MMHYSMKNLRTQLLQLNIFSGCIMKKIDWERIIFQIQSSLKNKNQSLIPLRMNSMYPQIKFTFTKRQRR